MDGLRVRPTDLREPSGAQARTGDDSAETLPFSAEGSTFPADVVPPPTRRAPFATERNVHDFSAWQNSLSALYAIEHPKDRDPGLFRFHGVTYRLGRSFLSRATGTAFSLVRSASHIAAHPVDVVSIFLCEAGNIHFDYDGLTGTLAPGDLVVLDYERPMSSTATDHRCSTIFLERDLAPLVFRSGEYHGSVLRASDVEAQSIQSYIGAVYAAIDDMTVTEAEVATRALFEHAARLWAFDEQSTHHLHDRRLARATAIMRENLTNPSLTAERIAREAGISRANLYRLFEPLGGVRAHLLNMRLDAAYEKLVQAKGKSIGEVATAFGFRTSSHFSRAFRKRFQIAPGEVASSQVPCSNAFGDQILDV